MLYGNEELLPRVIAASACPDFQLLITFQNGEKRRFDVSPLLSLPAYRHLRKVFPLVSIAYGTVVWPGDLDISPDTLYLKSVPVSATA